MSTSVVERTTSKSDDPVWSLPSAPTGLSPKRLLKHMAREVAYRAVMSVGYKALKDGPQDLYARWKDRHRMAVELPSREVAEWLAYFATEELEGQRHDRFRAFVDGPPSIGGGGLVEGEDEDMEVTILPTPTNSSYRFVFEGVQFEITHDQEEQGKKKGFRDRFTLLCWHGGEEVVKRLLGKALRRARVETRGQIATFMMTQWGDWRRNQLTRARPLESVVLEEGVAEEVMGAVQAFLDDEDYYLRHGIPYRLGVLLYGMPGTGKSSLAKAVASELGVNLYQVNLSTSGLSDGDLMRAFLNTKPRSLILIEDIDCAFSGREEGEDHGSKVTFSGLLNVLDGVAAQEGRITFMTTNHIEKLDEALIRKGRADLKVRIGPATRDQARRLFLKFFPGENGCARAFAETAEGQAPATLQHHLMAYRGEPEAASFFDAEQHATP